MSLIVLMDSGPLGLATNPKASPTADACKRWLRDLRRAGHPALVPEIIDYELRRELRPFGKVEGLGKIDEFKTFGQYLPLTTERVSHGGSASLGCRRDSGGAGGDAGPGGLGDGGGTGRRRHGQRRPLGALCGGAGLAGHLTFSG